MTERIPYEKPVILEKPRRCPKCGKAAVGFQLSTNPANPIWVYVCSGIDCDETTDYYATQAEAIAAWNRRADA